MVVFDEAVSVGLAATVIAIVFVVVQFPLEAVMVYVMLEVGEAITLDPFVAFNPVDGLHVYDEAPAAESVVVLPVHIKVLPEVVTLSAFTPTDTEPDAVQP